MSKYVSDDHVSRLLIVETIILDRPREFRFSPRRSRSGWPRPRHRRI